jgi:hypothetical protein
MHTGLERGVSIDMQNTVTVGWTPCHTVSAGGSVKVLKLLMRLNADIDNRDKGRSGWTTYAPRC